MLLNDNRVVVSASDQMTLEAIFMESIFIASDLRTGQITQVQYDKALRQLQIEQAGVYARYKEQS